MFNWFRKGRDNLQIIRNPTFEDYANVTVSAADIARRYGSQPKATALLKRFIACNEASTPAMINASMLAQFTPRMYKRASAKSPFKGVQQRPIHSKSRKDWIRSSNPETGVGSVAQYAQSGDVYEVSDHPFLRLINKPNPHEPGRIFWNMDFLQREIFGNSYSLVIVGDDGYPEELRHLYGQHVSPVPDKDLLISSYVYKVKEQSETFGADDIVHLKHSASPFNLYEGSSWFERVVPEMDLLIQAKATEQARFENGLRTDFAVLMPEANPYQVKAMKEEIKREHGGVRRAGGVLFLMGANSLQPITRTNKEMEYEAGMSRSSRNIRQAAGIPEAMANLNEANLASALQANGQYRQITIQPKLAAHAEQLTAMCNRFYGLEEGDYWIAYDNIVEINRDEIVKTTISLWTSNLVRLNEARAEVNYDPDPSDKGDKYYSELAAPPPAAPLLEEPPEEVPLTPVNQPAQEKPVEAKPLPEPQPEKAAKAAAGPVLSIREYVCPCQKCSQRRKEPSGWEYAFKQDDYDALRANVQGWLSKSAESGTYSTASLKSALEPVSRIFQDGGKSGLAELSKVPNGTSRIASTGANFDVLSPEVSQFIDGYSISLAQRLSAEKKRALKKAVKAGIEGGENTREATTRVLAELKGRTRDDAERIAVTESSRAYSQGTLKSWDEAEVEKKRWLLAGGPCPLCEEIARKFNDAIPLGDSFFKLGETITVEGKTYAFDYEAIDAAPAHPQCRCSIVPVLD